jgi:polysaccharide pyruvyl transferase WcaK-like protein
MKKIGLLGAYSIDNTGDQILGYAVRQALRERAPGVEQVLLAPALRGDFWRHAWTAERGLGAEIRRIGADESTSWAKGLDAVVIGGGGLLRLEPDFRPFLLGEASEWSAKIPAAWNSIGGETTPAYLVDQRSVYRAIKRCCETLAYVSVRNEGTARLVRRCGFGGTLHVVPDPTMLLSLPATGAGRGDAILRDAGIDTGKFVVGLSVGASIRDGRAAHFYKELFSALAAQAGAAQIAIFPFGNIYGDAELQRVAQQALPGARLIEAPLSAVDRWLLVGALDLHVCARYHAMLAAFSQDVPFLVLDEYLSDAGGTSKIREFVVATDLDAFYLSPTLSMRPRQKLANAMTIVEERGFTFAPTLARLRSDLATHYDAMTAALGLRA